MSIMLLNSQRQAFHLIIKLKKSFPGKVKYSLKRKSFGSKINCESLQVWFFDWRSVPVTPMKNRKKKLFQFKNKINREVILRNNK